MCGRLQNSYCLILVFGFSHLRIVVKKKYCYESLKICFYAN